MATRKTEIEIVSNPFELFSNWFSEIKAEGIENPDAVNVSTIDPDGHPESRMVLMRKWDSRGFSFFTNYQSVKSNSLDLNPWGHMCFFWQIHEKQIRIQGAFEKTSVPESEDYWNSRPRESQLNAVASQQSKPLSSRRDLEAEVERVARELGGKPVPRPAHWGGWKLVPWKFEFWFGHPFRLHDRVVYQRFGRCPSKEVLLSTSPGGDAATTWTSMRLQP